MKKIGPTTGYKRVKIPKEPKLKPLYIKENKDIPMVEKVNRYVFCKDCKYYSRYLDQPSWAQSYTLKCVAKQNQKIIRDFEEQWITVEKGASEINNNNDCLWYEPNIIRRIREKLRWI